MASFSTIYAFGDSLSDAGNDSLATSLTGTTPASPPYFSQSYGLVSANTFSNGPTWTMDLSLALGLGTLSPSLTGGNDFAYGGAETGSTPQSPGGIVLAATSLPSQIVQFEAGVSRSQASGALFTLSIGANDLLDILSQPALTAAQQAADVAAAVANEIAFIGRLASDGAKTLLVLDVPDLGKTPTVLRGTANGSNTPSAALDALASNLSAQYNAALESKLPGVAGISTTVVDAYRLIDSAVANPAAYGVSNVTTPVWSGTYSDARSGTLSSTNILTQDQSLFWDSLHPTETGHQGITALAEQALAGGSNPTAEVSQAYLAVLARVPDAPGLALWTGALSSGALAPTGFNDDVANSPEAQGNVVPIVDLYTILGRAPDQAGLQFWVQQHEAGAPLSGIAAGFLASSEGQRIYGTPVVASASSDAAFVNKAYQEVLGRSADAGGFAAWTGALRANAITPGAVLADFVLSSEAQARDAPAATNFLVAAANGTANYGGSLFPAG